MSVSKVKSLLLVGLVLGSNVCAMAGYGSGSSGKVAVVDMRSVVEGSKHFAQMQANMQKNLGAKHEELMLARTELTKEQEALKKQKAVMAAATFKKKQEAMDKKQTKLAERERAFQEEVMKTQDESMKKLYTAVKASTEKIAKKNGFDLVIQAEPLFSTAKNDLTSSVKKDLESKDKL